MKKLLIANRGEIAIRVARSAAEMGIDTIAVFSEDDALSLHTRKANEARALPGKGAAAYLDIAAILTIAREAGADTIHPGYGFLSENAGFATACAKAGIVFVGPSPESLALFGDKGRARELAEFVKVPVMPGTRGGITVDEARKFLEKTGAIMLKAVAGGGGRGMRPVLVAADLEQAYARCESEAKAAFGNGALYAEEFFPHARHVEVQIVGDGKAVSHLWDRECSLQRQRQKIIEIAPASDVPEKARKALFEAAIALGEAAKYRNLGTIEFLVDAQSGRFAFIEANARLQVEHTVTEEITGLDLVHIQLRIAQGQTLKYLHLTQPEIPQPRGVAIQARINLETMTADGGVKPAGGTLTAYEPPSGRGIRVDGFGYQGYQTSVRFDSLLAKLVVHAGNIADAKSKAYRALCEF
ncbi:MAG TPA: biotin carboxylase N-terminal domain-containing protein, partial [Rhizomicrobium sp.]